MKSRILACAFHEVDHSSVRASSPTAAERPPLPVDLESRSEKDALKVASTQDCFVADLTRANCTPELGLILLFRLLQSFFVKGQRARFTLVTKLVIYDHLSLAMRYI